MVNTNSPKIKSDKSIFIIIMENTLPSKVDFLQVFPNSNLPFLLAKHLIIAITPKRMYSHNDLANNTISKTLNVRHINASISQGTLPKSRQDSAVTRGKEDKQESTALSLNLHFTRAQFFASHARSQRVHSAAALPFLPQATSRN